MFQKILIANRGEIAVRIARTARRMGIATVAVHSDADAGAQHVLACDEAVAIGPAPVSESYLKADRILAAAKATGAQAIHPGYGFLSENPDFAEAVADAGLIFIGPPAGAIRAMGLKDAAKRLMEEAGVPVTPGYHGPEQDPGYLAERAAEIGYPVLVKASAGGGGKGMRKVDRAEDFSAALTSARSEAASSFGAPVTSTTSTMLPISMLKLMPRRSPGWISIPARTAFLKPSISTVSRLGRVVKQLVSATTSAGWWNNPTLFLAPGRLTAVLPPTAASTCASRVVGSWTYSTPRR